jgi:hypothetical protein
VVAVGVINAQVVVAGQGQIAQVVVEWAQMIGLTDSLTGAEMAPVGHLIRHIILAVGVEAETVAMVVIMAVPVAVAQVKAVQPVTKVLIILGVAVAAAHPGEMIHGTSVVEEEAV